MEQISWKEGWRQNSSDKWRDDSNRWRNREWTRGENITIRQIDLSVMNEGNGLVERFVPVTSGLIVGRFVRGWKGMEYCDADWQRRSTRERQFAFSLHSRLTFFSCVVSHWHTHAHTAMNTHTYRRTNKQTSWCCLWEEPLYLCSVWVTATVWVCVGFGNRKKKVSQNRLHYLQWTNSNIESRAVAQCWIICPALWESEK